MEVKKGLYYSEDHEWVKVEDGVATIGITDFAQHSMGEIVYVELPMEEDELDAGDVFGVLESVKAASDSFTPVSGEVVAVNEVLEDETEINNEKPLVSLILKIFIANESELKDLM